MLILKSFYRKKSTKIYLTVITLLFIGIISLFIARYYNINEANKIYYKSYIIFSANKEDLTKIENIKGINSLKFGLKGQNTTKDCMEEPDCEPNYLVIFNDNTIVKNHAKITLFNPKTGILLFNNEKITFTIDQIIETKKEENYSSLYISKTDFNTLSSKTNEYFYILTPKKWLDKEKIIKTLKKEIPSLSNLEEHEYRIKPFEYYTLNVTITTIFLIILSIIFLIILLINTKNILIDENKNSKLLKCLGFHKSTIKKYNVLKIISLLVLSIIISTLTISLIIIVF